MDAGTWSCGCFAERSLRERAERLSPRPRMCLCVCASFSQGLHLTVHIGHRTRCLTDYPTTPLNNVTIFPSGIPPLPSCIKMAKSV